MGQGKGKYDEFRRDKRGGGYGNERDSGYDRESSYGGQGRSGSSYGASRDRGGDQAAEAVVGTLKFFNTEKGFGFVSVPGKNQDVFLHVTKLGDYDGPLPEGATIHCHVQPDPRKGEGKLTVSSIESVDVSTASEDASSRPARGPRPTNRQSGPSETATGRIKTFRHDRGFGFVDIGGGREVFVHISLFERGGLQAPEEGDRFEVEFSNEDRGLKGHRIRPV